MNLTDAQVAEAIEDSLQGKGRTASLAQLAAVAGCDPAQARRVMDRRSLRFTRCAPPPGEHAWHWRLTYHQSLKARH